MGGFNFDIPSFGLKKSLGVNPFNPNINAPGGGFEAPSIEPPAVPEPSRYDAASGHLKGLMGQTSPEMEAYQTHLGGRPEREDPGIGRKLAAALMSGLAGWKGQAGRGAAIGRNILDQPYNREMRDWAETAKRMEAGARLGESGLNRERQLAQFELGEAGRAEGREDLAEQRDFARTQATAREAKTDERWDVGQQQREEDITRRGEERDAATQERRDFFALQNTARMEAEKREAGRRKSDPLYQARASELESTQRYQRTMQAAADPNWKVFWQQDPDTGRPMLDEETGQPVPNMEVINNLDENGQRMFQGMQEAIYGPEHSTPLSTRSGSFIAPTPPEAPPSTGWWQKAKGLAGTMFGEDPYGPGGGLPDERQPVEPGEY